MAAIGCEKMLALERALYWADNNIAGDVARGTPTCQVWHGADGRGRSRGYDAPALAGMSDDYCIASMQAFQDRSRANDLGNCHGRRRLA